jgi:hypothetical protein
VSEFAVVPAELRAAAGQVEPLAATVEGSGGELEGPVQTAAGTNPEFATSPMLEAFGTRMVEVLGGLGRTVGEHASLLNEQAASYERSDGDNARMFEV